MPTQPRKPASKPTERQGLVSLAEAAAYLGLSEGTLRNWVSMRRIEYVKIGSRTCFRPAALDAYIAAQTVPAVNR
jgi:excisionase family DNA binding protein